MKHHAVLLSIVLITLIVTYLYQPGRFSLSFFSLDQPALPWHVTPTSSSNRAEASHTAANVTSTQHVSSNQSWTTQLERLYGAAVPSSINPATSTNEDSNTTCADLLKQAFAAGKCIRLAREQTMSVLVCSASGNRAGTVLIDQALIDQVNDQGVKALAWYGNVASSQPQNVFRVRFVGPEIVQPAIHYCTPRTALAQFQLTAAGTYHMEVLKLYDNFTYSQPPLVRQNIHVASAQLTVAEAAEVATTAPGSEAIQQPNSASSSPQCTGHSHPGRWVLAPAPAAGHSTNHTVALLQALQHTCVFHVPGKQEKGKQPPYYGCPLAVQRASLPDVEDSEQLEWLPYDCRYRKVTRAVGAACKAALEKRSQQRQMQHPGRPGQVVCFLGDSQMRHIYNQVLHLLEGPSGGFRNLITNGTGWARAFTVLKSKRLMYVPEKFGNDTIVRVDSVMCSHVFVNFGQWPISHSAGPEPWSMQRYAQQVQVVAEYMVSQRRKYSNQQYWLTTNPIPFLDNMHQHKGPYGFGVDWRTDPFTLMYNRVANTVMRGHDIPVVDTYSMAASLSEVSYDAAHYVGTVGLAQASMIVNILCSDQDIKESL